MELNYKKPDEIPQKDFRLLAKEYLIVEMADEGGYKAEDSRKFVQYFQKAQQQYGVLALICYCDGVPAGFSIAQTDRQPNPWCYREGQGFIREFFVRENFRKSGIGRDMAARTEEALLKDGAQGLYLTPSHNEGAQRFWRKMGYRDSGTIHPKNDQKIYIKTCEKGDEAT